MALNRGRFMKFVFNNNYSWSGYEAVAPNHEYESYDLKIGDIIFQFVLPTSKKGSLAIRMLNMKNPVSKDMDDQQILPILNQLYGKDFDKEDIDLLYHRGTMVQGAKIFFPRKYRKAEYFYVITMLVDISAEEFELLNVTFTML